MKKMTFALACASTLALFATDFPVVATFEGVAPGFTGPTMESKSTRISAADAPNDSARLIKLSRPRESLEFFMPKF